MLPKPSNSAPTSQGTLNTATECRNLDESACLRLSIDDPKLCQNDCIKNYICPKLCQQCVKCYSCNEVISPNLCTQTTSCGAGKECFQLETLSGDLRPVFRLGCVGTSTCKNFHPHVGQTFGRRQSVSLVGGCCSSDLCNNQLIHEQSTTTMQIPTTTVIKPAVNLGLPSTCQQPTSSCPHGFHFSGNSCYYVGQHKKTQPEAKIECENLCSRLLIISSEQENKGITDIIHHSRQLLGVREDTHYWIGAYRSDESFSGNWVWSSTGQNIDSTAFSNWRSGSHPHPNDDGEHCADMGIGESSHLSLPHGYYWDHRSCYHAFLPICEIPLGNIP